MTDSYGTYDGRITDLEGLAALRARAEKAEAAVCRARESIGKNHVANFERIAQVADVLSSTAPCPHAEEAKRLREAVEWILDRHDSGVMHPVHDWDELRRRAGEG